MKGPAGFTLLELMIVLVIIGILASVFAVAGGKLFGSSQQKETRALLDELAARIEGYRTDHGEYPSSRLDLGKLGVGNNTNASAEALFLALFHPDSRDAGNLQKWLVNTDGDETSRPMTSLPDKQLFEIGDSWQNPVAYFESLFYEEEETFLAGYEDLVENQEVRARRNDLTGGWEAPGRFQLLSAGEDGVFGTADDLLYPH